VGAQIVWGPRWGPKPGGDGAGDRNGGPSWGPKRGAEMGTEIVADIGGRNGDRHGTEVLLVMCLLLHVGARRVWCEILLYGDYTSFRFKDLKIS
jgi:hypothetical protein